MSDEWDAFQQAYDKYREAKAELSKFYGITNLRFDGEFYTYSCADCGVDLYCCHKDLPSTPVIPLLHCGKVRLGSIF